MTTQKKTSGEPEPRVGIFWLLPQTRLIFDVTPVSAAEEYGNALTHPRSHLSRWTALQRSGQAPPDTEYETFARGRVSFFPLENKFGFFADRCILTKSTVIRKILATMHLPSNKVEFHTDEHYRCATCLRRQLRE